MLDTTRQKQLSEHLRKISELAFDKYAACFPPQSGVRQSKEAFVYWFEYGITLLVQVAIDTQQQSTNSDQSDSVD